MNTPAPLIEVSDLHNKLGGQWVHRGVNLTVNPREIVAIVGNSGSGKTTILRSLLMLLPLEQKQKGSIKIFGTELKGCPAKKALAIQRRWGVLFQRNALFSSLTLLENVQFPLRTFTQLPPDLQKQIALLKIAMSGLPLDAALKYPSQLSGGMQKRAALARAMVLDPELLFLDEPTSGLDPQSAGAFDELILQLRDTLGLTVVMVTHDLDSLSHIADRVAFLGDGKVLAELPFPQLVKQKNPLIQAFFAGHRGSRFLKKKE